MNEEQSDNKKSEFNAGIAIVMAIRNYKDNAHEARALDNYNLWRSALESIRSELEGDIYKHSDDILLCNKLENVINNKLQIYYSQKSKKSINIASELRKNLNEYELVLMRLENKYGYGMPSGKDKRFMLSGN